VQTPTFPRAFKLILSAIHSQLRYIMAPVPEPSSTLAALLTHILKRIPSTSTPLSKRNNGVQVNPSEGVTPFNNVPTKALFGLFGLIGVFFVVLGIWFFFWAKNGGFYFKENDWDDYKSTVLRRKGPNGTTLSGATSHTDLGGGSVVHGEKSGRSVWGRRKGRKETRGFDEETAYMGSGGGSDLGSDMSEIMKEKKLAKKMAKKAEKEREKESGGGKRSIWGRKKRDDYDDERTVTTEAMSLSHAGVEEDVDPEVRDAVRAYRHEKPARVGGLNKPSDGVGSTWDGSTEASSDLGLMSHREPTPTNTPVKKSRSSRPEYTSTNSGIRKVVSTSHGNHTQLSQTDTTDFWTRSMDATESQTERERERERIKAEARKLQEKGRAASSHSRQSQSNHRSSRRDFSFQHGDDDTHTVVSSTLTTSTITSEEQDRQARREARRAERERRHANRGDEGKERSRSPKKQSVPGSYYEDSVVGSSVNGSEVSGDTGTKSYPCVIPGLSVKKEDRGNSARADEYKEERRRRRANGGGGGGGYRRGRGDDLE